MDRKIIDLLKKDVQDKFGKNILHGRDCATLSKQIYNDTQRQISSSTVKRFFGIVKSRFYPSKYTLETFVLFLGFKGWDDYLGHFDDTKNPNLSSEAWENLQNRAALINEHSLTSLKQKTGYFIKTTVFRPFLKEWLEVFLESKKTASLFVAPDGYGKSTLLIQLVEHLLSKEDDFKNDLVFLIDGGIFFNLYSKHSNNELLHQILDFKINTSFAFYFHSNPKKRKGRVWLIIDSVDEIFFDKERYHHLIENLMRLVMSNDNGWYKVLFTCRPENMDIFTYIFNKTPLLEENWFGVQFHNNNMAETINVPGFTTEEIELVLKNTDFEYDFGYLEQHFSDILDNLSNPYFLSLFLDEFKKNKKISELNLLENFLHGKLHSSPYRDEKLKIINSFVELCSRGKETYSVRKDLLLTKANHDFAYRRLISNGIFYEYVLPLGPPDRNTFVKFKQNMLFEYFLFTTWISGEAPEVDTILQIKDYYKNNIQLQCSLLKLITRDLLQNNRRDTIEQLLFHLEKTTSHETDSVQLPPCLSAVCSVIKNTLRSDDILYSKITPWLDQSKYKTQLYRALE